MVSSGDVVYHLGETAWHSRISMPIDMLLTDARTKILILGNRDVLALLKGQRVGKGDTIPVRISERRAKDRALSLSHGRLESACGTGSWALHGHSHGTLPVNLQAKTFDVGTMCWEYRPISFDEVAEEMQRILFKPVDHHGVIEVQR